jgi:Rrf2 family protein
MIDMRISAKGRYAIASVIYIAKYQNGNDLITVMRVSNVIGVSKVHLEQVFSILKKAKLVNSVKGATGGYRLSKEPKDITVYDILKETETTLFDTTEQTLSAKAAFIDRTLDSKVWEGLDKSVSDYLSSVTVAELVEDAFVNNTDI